MTKMRDKRGLVPNLSFILGSMDKKLKPIGLENVEENRRLYRQVYFFN